MEQRNLTNEVLSSADMDRIGRVGLTPLDWAKERLANSERIAKMKAGDDREQWHEDEAYWRAIVIALASAAPAATQDGNALAVALATIRRLNRRCQTAEAALSMRVEQFEQRSKGALRNHYFDRGRECERGRMFAPPTDLERAAEAVIAKLLPASAPSEQVV